MSAFVSPLKNVANEEGGKENPEKKRSLPVVNEHFKPDFDAASLSAAVFQRGVI